MIHTTLAGVFNEFGIPIVLLVGLLLIFGKRMPDIGRSLGKGITEFKKGLAGIEDDVQKPATPAADAHNALPPTQPQKTLPAGSPSVEEELRATREQLRQLSEELKATQAQVRQQSPKPPTA
jgi:sec-independent protein translocase protein TatA